MLGFFFVWVFVWVVETVTFRMPLLRGASFRKASLYRSMILPFPQAHQSIRVTVTHRDAAQTRTFDPRQFPCRNAAPAAAYIPLL
jgi:hypothetical protein